MESKRREIMPGIWYTQVTSGTLPCSGISINFLTQLQRETAAQYALIPYVLSCGSSRYDNREALSKRFNELGGVELFPVVRKYGEIQSTGLKMLIPAGASIADSCRLLCSMIVNPATKGGLLVQKYVDEQKELLSDSISDIDDIAEDNASRCVSEMCCYEDYSTPVTGALSDLSSIYYKKLTRSYQELLQTAPVEIISCSPDPSIGNLFSILQQELSVMPRGEINYDIGTDIRMNSVAETLRIVTDDVAEGTETAFSLGCRLGECMEDPDFAAIELAAELIRRSVSDIAGYRDISVTCDLHKGIAVINGICPKANADRISEDIRRCFRAVTSGKYEEAVVKAASEAASANILKTLSDASVLEDFLLTTVLLGVDFSPEELSALVLETGLKEASSVLKSIEFDLICITTIE